MQPKVEFLRYAYPKVEEHWVPFEVAIDGKLASFSIHAADWHETPEAKREQLVIREAQHYLEAFGDFRLQRR